MPQELIPVSQTEVNGGIQQTVDARKLHEFLEVGRDFTTWLKGRINRYGFIENTDYVVFTQTGENPLGGRPAAEYYLILDMAKQLAMVESNEKGLQARRYFIECERRVKTAFEEIPDKQFKILEAQNKNFQAALLNNMADSGQFTSIESIFLKAEAVSVLSGKPIANYLPKIAANLVGQSDVQSRNKKARIQRPVNRPENIVSQFLACECQPEKLSSVSALTLYKAFSTYCIEKLLLTAFDIPSLKSFGLSMKSFCSKKRASAGIFYLGIKLN
ncbi:MAG: antA/AntB antirepressor family protein [Deltaproteobacteria bacterium]|jgi:phage anti-repressor protein|nr:antA/AntB antirepressor family protein [Deltaproteobacteria bacterium]